MRFLVVLPQYKPQPGLFYDFPLGLAYISSVLKHKGYDVSCLNLNVGEEPVEKQVERAIVDNDVDVLCTGGLCTHYQRIKSIIDTAREVKGDIKTVIGGGLISAEPEMMVNALRPTFGVIGEGERTIEELAEAMTNGGDYGKINGLCYHDEDGQFIKTPARDPIMDLDSLPYPDYAGFGIDKYLDDQLPNDSYYMYPFDKPRLLPVISSRSCPYKCTFCFHPLGDKYRSRSLDNFFGELEYLIETYQINMVAILDEVLSINKRRLREFCDRIKPLGLKFMVQLRVNNVNEDILTRLKDAGCFYISYGLESANNEMLKSMNKFITVEQIEKALALTRKFEIGIQGNFLFSCRDETLQTATETFNWWARHMQYHIHLNTLVPYPGSDDWKYCIEKKLIPEPLKYIEDGSTRIVNLSKMTNAEYANIHGMLVKTRCNLMQFAEVVSIKMTGFSQPRRAPLYTLTVKCNQCGRAVTYNNLHLWSATITKLACRLCNQRFDLSPEIFEHFKPFIPKFREQCEEMAFDEQTLATFEAIDPKLMRPPTEPVIEAGQQASMPSAATVKSSC